MGTPAQVALARALYDDQRHSIAEICSTPGISRATFYRAVATTSAGAVSADARKRATAARPAAGARS